MIPHKTWPDQVWSNMILLPEEYLSVVGEASLQQVTSGQGISGQEEHQKFYSYTVIFLSMYDNDVHVQKC